jgi:hypothetical protein
MAAGVCSAPADTFFSGTGRNRYPCDAGVVTAAQRMLDEAGWSDTVVARLIRIEWFRFIPHLINAAQFLWLIGRVIGISEGAAS